MFTRKHLNIMFIPTCLSYLLEDLRKIMKLSDPNPAGTFEIQSRHSTRPQSFLKQYTPTEYYKVHAIPALSFFGGFAGNQSQWTLALLTLQATSVHCTDL
jgi:hypothetical protein